jgi:Transposase Tn5 dimerisation domain
VREFFLALARLGGHQNRKCDGEPGWLVLWRGWMTLQQMVDGARASRCPKAASAAPSGHAAHADTQKSGP